MQPAQGRSASSDIETRIHVVLNWQALLTEE